jgi:magnesium-transporting ATPase (P-type)
MLTALFGFLMVYQMNGISSSCLLNTTYNYWSYGSANFGGNGCGPVISDAQQVIIYQQSVAAWYAMIICCQAMHVFTCKTRLNSLFDHPIFANSLTFLGVIVALLIMCFCIYTPGVQAFFSTYNLPGQIFPCALVFWVFIVCYIYVIY